MKSDAGNAAAFDERDLPPFVYEGKSGKSTVMSYREAPPEALEDPGEMVAWARLGQEAALRAAAKRKPAKSRSRKAAARRCIAG
ncbi:MAG: TfoX/Sxy family protein [Kiritimatiellia bacterium]